MNAPDLNAIRARADMLAQHQIAEHRPYGVKCLCGVEISDRNADPFDASVSGRGRAIAEHQLQMLGEGAFENEQLRAVVARVETALATAPIYRPDSEMYGFDAWDNVECIDIAAIRRALGGGE